MIDDATSYDIHQVMSLSAWHSWPFEKTDDIELSRWRAKSSKTGIDENGTKQRLTPTPQQRTSRYKHKRKSSIATSATLIVHHVRVGACRHLEGDCGD
jgi:hypothetical protein